MRSEQVNPVKSKAYQLGGWMLFLSAAVILAALAFEYIGQYEPCPLCLIQRYAYYAGVPLLFVSLILLSAEKAKLAALVFFARVLGFSWRIRALACIRQGPNTASGPGRRVVPAERPSTLRQIRFWPIYRRRKFHAATSLNSGSWVSHLPAGTH